MAEATRPTGDLALLTAASGDPGVDLEEMLGALADQLADAWPSPVGLALTVVLDGVAVTLTAGHRDLLITAHAVLTLPLCTPAHNDVDNRVVFYAAPVCDFADLAAVGTRSAGRDRTSVHRHTAHRLGVSGLAEFSARNEAIGVLTEQGHTPDEARIEIQCRATRNARTVPETAQDILDNLPQRGVPTRWDRMLLNGFGGKSKRSRTPNPTVMHVRADTNNAPVARMRQPTSRARTGSTRGADLTTPERAVLGLLIAGGNTTTIAATLHLVPGTVRNHAHAIMAKLGAHSNVETVAIGLNRNILGTA